MSDALPPAVQRRLVTGRARLAWIRLEDGLVSAAGGALAAHGLVDLRVGKPLPEDLVWASALEGGLPLDLRAIASEGGGPERTDVVAWEGPDGVFVVVADSGIAARFAGEVMQRENGEDLLRERLEGAERLRRGERRSRSEALRALGYEILERGPDGLFRPTQRPAPWLDGLLGWDDGRERVTGGDDPVDFLGAFLMDTAELFEGRAEDARTVRSGIWTETLDLDDEGARDHSFEAHGIRLSDGRGLVAIERLNAGLEAQQSTLQHQRDAELSYEGLAREMQVKDVLLHCIVHDLRGPLSGLVGSLSLLEMGGLGREDQRELIEVGLRQARHQEEMIKHILEVFSAEYEALSSFEEEGAAAPDAALTARECVARQRPAFAAAGVELAYDGPEGPVPVVGRADRLDRILSNLLGNALRHAPAGSAVHARLEELEREGARRVRLSVLDRGPGVPDEIAGDLFQRFVQGGSKGAAGLGLYYIRMTVEPWGGRCWYEPREGGGAAFHVEMRGAS